MSAPSVTIHGTEQHELDCQHVGDRFQISVALPQSYGRKKDRSYPTVYVLDGNSMFGLAVDTIRLLQLGRELPELIVVGIGYPVGPATGQVLALRTRDLTPTVDPEARAGYGDVPGLPDHIPSGGAARFLAGLRDELIPFIESRYRSNADRVLVGDSLGGLFGLYTLFSEPSSFARYVLGSPSIWWRGTSILQDEAKFAAANSDLAARVFMSVGLDEEPGPEADAKARSDQARALLARMREARMVSNLRDLAATLQGRAYDGLALTTHLFEGETHLSVVPATISRGLRVVFG